MAGQVPQRKYLKYPAIGRGLWWAKRQSTTEAQIISARRDSDEQRLPKSETHDLVLAPHNSTSPTS